jgi:hypothetical protein
MTLIAVVNQSTMVSNADLTTMCQAIQVQLNLNFLPAFNLRAATISFYPSLSLVPGYAWIMYIVDNDAQVAGALGFHEEETNGRIDGYIMCEPILTNGGVTMLYSPSNPTQYTISATLSHETMEMIGDRFAGNFSVGPQVSQGNLFCVETCDPVESLNYGITVNGVQIAVSNFVYPSYWNPDATSPANLPFDHLNQLTKPFTISAGGYQIVATISNEGEITAHHIFGKDVPQWRKDYAQGKFYRRQKKIRLINKPKHH